MSALAAGPHASGTAAPQGPQGSGAARAPLRVALIGNPNTGKTTLFNALTGLRQKVANYAGVTVERVEGAYRDAEGRAVVVTDLPGTYSLTAQSPDEAIALDVLLGRARGVPAPDVVVVVADALHLERNLFLVSQVMELGRPTVVALNQIDAAEAAGVRIDIPELIHELGVTVIPTVATKREGLDRLRQAVGRALSLPLPARRFVLPPPAADALAPLEGWFREHGLPPQVAELEALRALTTLAPEARRPAMAAAAPELQVQAPEVAEARSALETAGLRPDSLEAELRYGWIAGVVDRTVARPAVRRRTTSDRIDEVLLHRVWGR